MDNFYFLNITGRFSSHTKFAKFANSCASLKNVTIFCKSLQIDCKLESCFILTGNNSTSIYYWVSEIL